VPSAHEVLDDRGACEAVLARILSGHRRLQTPSTPDYLIGVMATIADRLPDLVNARSFSSFETASRPNGSTSPESRLPVPPTRAARLRKP